MTNSKTKFKSLINLMLSENENQINYFDYGLSFMYSSSSNTSSHLIPSTSSLSTQSSHCITSSSLSCLNNRLTIKKSKSFKSNLTSTKTKPSHHHHHQYEPTSLSSIFYTNLMIIIFLCVIIPSHGKPFICIYFYKLIS